MKILGEMIVANSRAEEEQFDMKMQLLSWQTALLMNSTGNYKKKIKPADLYSPIHKEDEQQEQVQESKSKEQLQAELLSTFAGSDVIIN